MDLVNPIKDILTGLWNCASNHSAYIRHLEDNLTLLKDEKLKLDASFKDVEQKVKLEEEHYKIRTENVKHWLERVEPMIKEADEFLQKGNEEIQKKCLGVCCPRNCCTSYKLGKEVIKKIEDVKRYVNEADFSVFTERLPLPPVVEMPVVKTVGMESKLSEVWRCVEDPCVEVIGLYGIGGVGKTTLLKKLNNKFIDTRLDFEVVIWITVSKEVKMLEIQEVIRKKLEIPQEIWKEKIDDEDGRATEIHRSLSRKKFVLLLDDLWEEIDLLKVGVPDSRNRKGSKIVLTSRFEDVCRIMGAVNQGSFKVDCLPPGEALDLFQKMVTEDVLKSHHEIQKLAKTVADECKGLPLALITIGRAMANRRKPEEWRHAIKELKANPSNFRGVDSIFRTLKLSYDSLSGDPIKNCFLYCSMFPEDHEINKHELINLWIAEGFLDNCGTLDDARDEGEYIIGSLKSACLLERGLTLPESHVKMHDVLRDLALWLASQKENEILVFENDSPIKKQGITTLQETVRITFFGRLIKDCGETPICPNLLSFVARDTHLKTFPGAFFKSMPTLKVLDLQGNLFLQKLPEETKLIRLEYLNLSNSNVETLPIEVKEFKQLRILLLDGTCRLGIIPEGVISSLSSLQVFSRLSTVSRELRFQEFWETGRLLEELKQLHNIEEISLTLFTSDVVDQLKSSLELWRCVKRLIVNCLELRSLDVSPGYFQNLVDLCVQNCHIKDLTCLRHAPQLRSFFSYSCELLEEIIAYDFSSSENDENLNFFQNLKLLHLYDLPNLKSICRQVMRFPSLERICVWRCDNLRKLPFKSALDANATIAMSILGSKKWWNKLEWEDEATKHYFRSKFSAEGDCARHYSYETKTNIRWHYQFCRKEEP